MRPAIIVSVILGGIILTVLTGFLYFLPHSMENQRDCSWAIIDNIELHAHIDIPATTGACGCDYQAKTNVKKVFYTVDQKLLGRSYYGPRYAQFMRLQKLGNKQPFTFNDFLMGPENTSDRSNLYFRQENHNGETWNILYNDKTGGLWITGRFAD